MHKILKTVTLAHIQGERTYTCEQANRRVSASEMQDETVSGSPHKGKKNCKRTLYIYKENIHIK